MIMRSLFIKSFLGARVITRDLVAGTDSRRRVYAASRRLLKFRTLRARRRTTRDGDGANLRIPPERGFELISREKLTGVEEVVASAQRLIDENPPEKRPWRGKQQLRTGNLDMRQLTRESPYLRFALQPDVLDAVSAYLGVIPLLVYVDVWYSCYRTGLSNSQLFHCDWGALSQVKVFVHASNVDASSGPLVVVGAERSQRIRDGIRYNYIRPGVIRDDQLGSFLGKEDSRALTGPPGTVAFVDTSRCFHYGSRLHEGAPPRVVAVFQFFTPFAFKVPLAHRMASPFRHLASHDMPPLERLVLGLD